jgi:signal transduction histidine kinase
VFLAGIVVPVALAAWSSYRTAHGIIHRHSVRHQAEVVDEIANDLLALQDHARAQLDRLARDPTLVAALGRDAALPEPLLQAFVDLNPRWTELTVLDAGGRPVWGHASPAGAGLDPFFLDTVVRGRLQSPVEVGPRGRLTRFGASVVDRWHLRGAVTATLDLAVLDPALGSLRAQLATRALIWDDRGLVFGSNLTPDDERRLGALVDLRAIGRQVLAASDERVHLELTLGNEPLLLVATSVPETISSPTSDPGEHWFLATLAPASQSFAELRGFQRRILAFLLFVFLAVTAFLVWISRQVSGPLARMTGLAEAVARGRRDLRLAPTGRDEIGRLGRSLDAMAAALGRYERELVGQEALATLGRTSALVAHEIRNPLNGIRGSIQYLQLRFPEDPVIDEYARLMLDRVDSLARFVDSLLRFARLPVPQWAPCSVAELFERAVEPFAARVAARDVRVVRDPGEATALACDGDQIVELLGNLVQNALDAVDERGEIVLSARRSGDWTEISVRDSGPGVAPALRARLFVPFTTSKREGTGLGLVMCRIIAENHGGRLELEETPAGACFVLRLPRAAGGGPPP